MPIVAINTRILGTMIIVLVLATFQAAKAETCTATIDPVAFGLVDVTSSAPVDTTTRIVASCTDGAAGQTVTFCPLIGQSTNTGYDRAMTKVGGADKLIYQLYTDASRVALWGNGTGAGIVPSFSVQLGPGGQGTGSRAIYARIAAPQLLVPVGTYLESLGSGDFVIRYGTASTNCSGSDVKTLTPNLNVSAVVVPQCTMTTTNLDFGTISRLTTPVIALGAIIVRCTATTNYTIALDGGHAKASDPESRWMGGTTPITGIRYGLYRDGAFLLPWGSGVQASTGIAAGISQSYPVYGKTASEPITPPVGHYTDSVIVTLNY
jgi:spore coat protein U-like protein